MTLRGIGYLFLGILLTAMLLPSFLQCQVRIGAQQTERYLPLLEAKRIGIVANRASVVPTAAVGSDSVSPRLVNIVDTLFRSGIRVIRIFSPEHGFRSMAADGEHVNGGTDSLTGIPVVSLYGKQRTPDSAQLSDIDMMVFDIQDVGARFYTYISTLALLMDACAGHGVKLLVLDRPNPNGFYLDGPLLEPGYASFVGLHQVPVVYGMTIGEYAMMVNGEGWLDGEKKCDLTVIPISGYDHETQYELPCNPSPNLPNMNAVYLYPSLCFFEGTMMSVGRGTSSPFEVYGHPAYSDSGFSFVPVRVPGKSVNPPLENKDCRGVDLRNFYEQNPGCKGEINLDWLIDAWQKTGASKDFFNNYFEKLAGTGKLKQQITSGMNSDEIKDTWQPDLENFKKKRKKYLLYPD